MKFTRTLPQTLLLSLLVTSCGQSKDVSPLVIPEPPVIILSPLELDIPEVVISDPVLPTIEYEPDPVEPDPVEPDPVEPDPIEPDPPAMVVPPIGVVPEPVIKPQIVLIAALGNDLAQAEALFYSVSDTDWVDCDNVGGGKWMCANFVDPKIPDVTIAAPVAVVVTPPIVESSIAPNIISNWTAQSPMKKPRNEAASALVNGKIYAFNGFANNAIIENNVERYNPATKQWTLLTTTSVTDASAVTHNGIIVDGDDVWLIGGRIGSDPGKVSNIIWIYNTTNNTWRSGPKSPKEFAGGGAAVVDNVLHYFGGMDARAQCRTNAHYTLSLRNPSEGWQTAEPMPDARMHFSTVELNGKIYAIGGQYRHDLGDVCDRTGQSNVVSVYDPANNTWERLGNLPTLQSHTEAGTFAYGGLIYMTGGITVESNKLLRYTPATDSWITFSLLPERLLSPVTRIIGNQLIVGGGGTPSSSISTDRVWVLTLDIPTTQDVAEITVNSGSSFNAAINYNGNGTDPKLSEETPVIQH
jgi:N-acetylneuraminic acid mutarotase